MEHLLDELRGREHGAVGAARAGDLQGNGQALVTEAHGDRAGREAGEIGVEQERAPVVEGLGGASGAVEGLAADGGRQQQAGAGEEVGVGAVDVSRCACART